MLFKGTFGQAFFSGNFFRRGFLERDFLNTVEDVTFHLVHTDRANRGDTVGLSDPFDGLGDVRILLSGRNGSGGH
jgi:hypothetical protein